MMSAPDMTRVEAPEQATFCNRPLEDSELQRSIQVLSAIFESSFGPRGKLKCIHNDCGGQVTVSSCSGRLLHSLSVKKPALKLVTTTIQEHLRLYADGGHLTGLLCLLLVENTLKRCPLLHRKLVAESYEILLDWCLCVLNRPDCACKYPIDFSNQQHLWALAGSIFGSKVGCVMSASQKEFMARLMVSVFLKVFTSSNSSTCSIVDKIRFICIEGGSPFDSVSEHGLLIESPHIPTYSKKELIIRRSTKTSENISTVLFNISLSGDSNDLAEAIYELDDGANMEDGVLLKIETCIKCLLKEEVGLFCCQKVIHPRVKQLLSDHGVSYLDRLGIANAKRLCSLSGCTPLSVLDPSLFDTSHLGQLSNISHRVLNNKSYLHLSSCSPEDSSVCTVLLYNWSEEALQETKYACETSLQCLEQTSRVGVCLAGGGCWQTWLASYIRFKATKEADEVSADLGCRKSQFLQTVNIFVSCLERIARTLVSEDCTPVRDLTYSHLWVVTSGSKPSPSSSCQCGAYRANEVLEFSNLTHNNDFTTSPVFIHRQEDRTNFSTMDPFLPITSAIRSGVSVANVLLTICQFIQDEN